MRLALCTALILPLAGAPSPALAGSTAEHHRLHVEQQRDALNLQLRQSASARRHALSPSDARRLDHLDLRQRIEQQQLELQQSQGERALDRSATALPPEARESRRRAQHEAFAQERALQLQRFDLDRQRELQTMPRRPLQSPLGSPSIDLR
jgi:hypothetical protein